MFKFTPIGGQDQIGQNCWQIEIDQFNFLIDCGVLFPNDAYFSISALIPDFSRLKNPRALVITHGHEDHIGAIPYLIEKFPKIKIYAPTFAYHLIEAKLKERSLKADLTIYNNTFTLGGCKITPLLVNHSIPFSYGLLVEVIDYKSIFLFVSDFKIDQSKLYERVFEFSKLKVASKYSRRILLADSTNILVEGKTGVEKDLLPSLNKLMKYNGRIFITSFASNIYRLQSIIDCAYKHKRVVVPYGRSMEKNSLLASRLSILKDRAIVRPINKVNSESKDLVVLLSGCQGEERGALNRIANGRDSHFKLRGDDLIIFSSRTIPGNEIGVEKIVNKLSTISKNIVLDIHISGHAAKDDLKMLYQHFKATDIVPVHGNKFFIMEHAKFAQSCHKRVNVHTLTNGDELYIDKNVNKAIQVRKGKSTQSTILYGSKNIPIAREQLNMRKDMAAHGMIVVALGNGHFTYQALGLAAPLPKLADIIAEYVDDSKLKGKILSYAQQILGDKPVVVIQNLKK